MNILVTAIGSFSADCVISTLKKDGHRVIGCDIYPAEWHPESVLCDKVYMSPLATKENEYLGFLLEICQKEDITHIIPLTDVEIDALRVNRQAFVTKGVTLCMPEDHTLDVARDKYQLYEAFKDDDSVPSMPTYKVGIDVILDDAIPCVAKPANGRSSEGLMRIYDPALLVKVRKNDNYIVQPLIDGSIFTVDYVRDASSGHDFSVPREELLRTKNGAGITVRVFENDELSKLVSHIGNKLNVNGCVNMEFILNDGHYYLIDINPRFSAGVAFSKVAGYDFVTSHLNCHIGRRIGTPIKIDEQIICKKYSEVVTKES